MFKSRKVVLFIFCLIAIIVCSIFKLDCSAGICALYTAYCAGNVTQKGLVQKGLSKEK